MIESAFFQDLAMLMAIAGLAAAVFSRLGWPKVLGYILAGVVMSEHTWGGSFLADARSTQTVGQLGVVFLMFGMGLSFSPREMRAVRSVALPAALLDTAVMTWLGYLVGTLVFGWKPVPSFFLGVAVCDSATTLLAKVIDEMNWGRRAFARYVLGTSVCEDVVCVGAIAVATGFATGGDMTAGAFFHSLGGLAVFFLSVLVFGFIQVPRLLSSVARRKDDEALVLTLLGCCFFISFFAYKYDYSLALGAFLMGVIGGSSDVRDRLARLVEPLKAMFAAVFFVSIGLLVDPHALMRHLPEILLVSGVVVVGKFTNIFLASVAAGTGIKTAVQNGFGLAQVGEFAFMTAILYAGLDKDADTPLFPIAVGASLLTTLVNPWLIRLSDPVGEWAERVQPRRLRTALSTYRAWIDKLRVAGGSAALSRARAPLICLGVYAVLILAAFVVCAQLGHFDYSRFSVRLNAHSALVFFLAAHVFSFAMLPLVLSSARTLGEAVASVLVGDEAPPWMQPLRQITAFAVLLAVLALFFFEWMMLGVASAPMGGMALRISLGTIAAITVFGWGFFVRAGHRATARFHEALTAEERRQGLAKTMTLTVPEGAIHRLTLEATSPAVGGTVVTLNIRAKTGASVVSVIRGGELTRNIGPEWEFEVGDTIVAIGDAHQIAALKDLLGVTS